MQGVRIEGIFRGAGLAASAGFVLLGLGWMLAGRDEPRGIGNLIGAVLATGGWLSWRLLNLEIILRDGQGLGGPATRKAQRSG